MTNLDVRDLSGEVVGSIELPEAAFGSEVKEHLLWEVVRWQRSRMRAGTHKVKNKSERSGSGKKPFKQKGTGNARQGSTRAVQYVGGGRIHGPQPRSYAFSMNKKARAAALRSALALKLKDEQLTIVKDFELETHKTRGVAAALGALGLDGALIVAGTDNNNLQLGARNLKGAQALLVEGLNVFDLLRYKNIVFTTEAEDALGRRLA